MEKSTLCPVTKRKFFYDKECPKEIWEEAYPDSVELIEKAAIDAIIPKLRQIVIGGKERVLTMHLDEVCYEYNRQAAIAREILIALGENPDAI